MTELKTKTSEELRVGLEAALEVYPHDRAVSEMEERLLDLIEEQLELDEPDTVVLRGWPEQFRALMPRAVSDQERIDSALSTLADGLRPEQYQTARLQLFSELLDSDENSGTAQAFRELEDAITQARTDYRRAQFAAEDVTAEALAAHEMLEEGFDLWLDAFAFARRRNREQAWKAAVEGNRCLVAVSLWSDSLRGASSSQLGEA